MTLEGCGFEVRALGGWRVQLQWKMNVFVGGCLFEVDFDVERCCGLEALVDDERQVGVSVCAAAVQEDTFVAGPHLDGRFVAAVAAVGALLAR